MLKDIDKFGLLTCSIEFHHLLWAKKLSNLGLDILLSEESIFSCDNTQPRSILYVAKYVFDIQVGTVDHFDSGILIQTSWELVGAWFALRIFVVKGVLFIYHKLIN